jgi:phosphoserine phosphatase
MRTYGTVIFDCDSTLCAIEGIDVLAGELHRDEIARLTDAAMRGEIPLEAVYGRRLDIVAPSRERVEGLGEEYVRTLVPDADTTVRTLQDAGVRVRIISGGLLPPVRAVGRELGIADEDISAVAIEFDAGGHYAGFDTRSPLARSGGKLDVVRAWRDQLPLPFLLVGDGITDLEAYDAVELFVAYTGVVARPEVIAGADYVLTGPSMAGILPLVLPAGYPQGADLHRQVASRRLQRTQDRRMNPDTQSN